MNPKWMLALFPFVLAACGSSSDPGDGGSGATGGSSAGTGGGGAGGAGGTAMAGSGTGGTAMAGSGTGGTGMAGTGPSGQCVSGTLTVAEANNYQFTSDIKVTPVKLKPNDPTISFDWSGVTTDFLGRTTDPAADIDSVLLVVFRVSLDEVVQHLNADDDLRQYQFGALQLLTNNTVTSASLNEFGVVGVPANTYDSSADVKQAVDDYLDPTKTDPATHPFFIMPSTGIQAGKNARMIQAFTIDPDATESSITIGASTRVAPGTDGHTGGTTGPSTSVTYDTDLEAVTPVELPAGATNIMVDWTQMTTNGLGREWIPRSIGQITVGHYSKSLKELQEQFFDLQTIADELYTAPVPSDDPISLSTLMDDQGHAFPGVDDTGAWVLALFCDPQFCANPAPWFLTVLKPCD